MIFSPIGARSLVVLLLAALALVSAPVLAEEQILFPEPDEAMKLRLDRALEHQLGARWHEAVRLYQPLLADPVALEVLVAFAVRDPFPVYRELRGLLRRVAAGEVDFTAGPAVGEDLILRLVRRCARPVQQQRQPEASPCTRVERIRQHQLSDGVHALKTERQRRRRPLGRLMWAFLPSVINPQRLSLWVQSRKQ